MISAQDIRERAKKLWDSGRPLSAWLGAGELFPYVIPFRKPSAQEWLDRFAELRAAAEQLERQSQAVVGTGYSVIFTEVAHQKLGRLRTPERVSFNTVEDLAAYVGESATLERFQNIARLVRAHEPRLMDWFAVRPMRALDCEPILPRLLAVVAYFQQHPRPLRYARELRIAGVDSKFIQENRTVLAEWLDRLLPSEAIDASERGTNDGGFERRYGLRLEEPLIRFRWLDPKRALGGPVQDAAVPVSQFAAYAPTCERVFVTENKINFLTLPECRDTLGIFGGGYAIDLLAQIPWLTDQPLYYWGDLDTHGFAILSRLRRHFPHTHSILMDRETLLAHQDLWTEELAERRSLDDLPGLNDDERDLYDDLRHDHFGQRVRLEQERVTYARVEAAIAAFH